MDLDFWGSFWREKVLFCRKDFTFVEESIGVDGISHSWKCGFLGMGKMFLCLKRFDEVEGYIRVGNVFGYLDYTFELGLMRFVEN